MLQDKLAVHTKETTLEDFTKIVNAYITVEWDLNLIQCDDIDDLMGWEQEEIAEAHRMNQCPIETAIKISECRN